jgi:hypothetical protein
MESPRITLLNEVATDEAGACVDGVCALPESAPEYALPESHPEPSDED